MSTRLPSPPRAPLRYDGPRLSDLIAEADQLAADALQLQPTPQAERDRLAVARLRRQAQDEREKAARAPLAARAGHRRWADTFEARAAAMEAGKRS